MEPAQKVVTYLLCCMRGMRVKHSFPYTNGA